MIPHIITLVKSSPIQIARIDSTQDSSVALHGAMLPPKKVPEESETPGTSDQNSERDILDMAESGSQETSHLESTADSTPKVTASRSHDTGCGCSEDSGMSGCYPVFSHGTQSMLTQQDPSSDCVLLDEDIESQVTASGGGYSFDSILCQFDTFFRSKLDAELQSFQECMHAMLTEQQMHIQRIISSISTQPVEETVNLAVNSGENMNETCSKRDNHSCVCQDSEGKARSGLMMELLSLSCQLSALLNLPKFAC